ncbi:MAG: AbrB/MazE/SpoVT family DNA-binding domain-containing protein, partial [Thaumarchaeota archaeon]|nr:AbrB/MazE/SpoVT family DNA-binding domain-containing protein [Nitrososphaerota archaeon]
AAVDKQGRLVLPSRIRESLGLKEGGIVTVRLDGSRLVIEPKSQAVESRVREWVVLATNTKNALFGEEQKESWKWMSHDYARRKLGLR